MFEKDFCFNLKEESECLGVEMIEREKDVARFGNGTLK